MGGRWNFVNCFGERQAEEVVEVVAWQVVLIVKSACLVRACEHRGPGVQAFLL